MPGESEKAIKTLDYGRPPSRWRKRRWKVAVVLLIVGLAAAGWPYRSQMWAKAKLLYWQRQCLNYSAPPNMVVFEGDPALTSNLLKQPGYFDVYVDQVPRGASGLAQKMPPIAAYRPPTWDALINLDVTKSLPTSGWPTVRGVCFMGELTTPSGERRLTLVECHAIRINSIPGAEGAVLFAYSFPPATLFKPSGNSVMRGSYVVGGSPNPPPLQKLRIFAGQRDPKDPSHFTIRYQAHGMNYAIDGAIDNMGGVTFTFRRLQAGPPAGN